MASGMVMWRPDHSCSTSSSCRAEALGIAVARISLDANKTREIFCHHKLYQRIAAIILNHAPVKRHRIERPSRINHHRQRGVHAAERK